MSNIVYNEHEEAYELPYRLWDSDQIIRFYVQTEDDIMSNFSDVAQKLALVDGSRRRIAELIVDEGYYEGSDADKLAIHLAIENIYMDIDEDGIVVCMVVDSFDGYLPAQLRIEIYEDDFEIIGRA
ncbi:MAG: hypothetical protein IJ874_08830 [Ruminococcus sp.]|nr:hypothetical protein [Ruminococcus sp.]